MNKSTKTSIRRELLRPGLDAFIFDLDGVIIDSEPLHLQITNDMLAQKDLSVAWDDYERFIGKTDDNFFRYVKEFAAYDESVEELIAEYKHRLEVFFNEALTLPIIPGIHALVETLHHSGWKLAIASSSSHVNIRHVLRAARLTEYFPIQVSGEDIKHGKPAPDIYLEAARQLGVRPAAAVAIEDSQAGSIAAKAAGLYTIGFQNPGSGQQNLNAADLVIDRITKLLA